jgi:hypothetical protein
VGELRNGSPFLPAAFVSPDGARWRQAASEREFGQLLPAGAAEDALGRIVVVGTRQASRDTTGTDVPNVVDDAGSFVSSDLKHWFPAGREPQLPGSVLSSVLSSGQGFVAFGGFQPIKAPIVGCDGGCAGVGIWTSDDGVGWVSAIREPDPNAVLTATESSIAFGGEYVTPVVWRVTDSVWQRVDNPSGLGGIPSAVWATGCEALGASVQRKMYVSEDRGTTWRQALGEKPALDGVIRTGEGFIGWSNVSDPIQGLWTSTDGFNWGPIDHFGRGDNSFGIRAAALLDSTLMVVGSDLDPGPFIASVMPYQEPPCLE